MKLQWRHIVAAVVLVAGVSLLPALHGHAHTQDDERCIAACEQAAAELCQGEAATPHHDADRNPHGHTRHEAHAPHQHTPSRSEHCTICIDLHLATCTPPAGAPTVVRAGGECAGRVLVTSQVQDHLMPRHQMQSRGPPAVV